MNPLPEILLTCPRCHTPKFSVRGLRAHVCHADGVAARIPVGVIHDLEHVAKCRLAADCLEAARTEARAKTKPHHSPMSKSKPATTVALATVSHPELKASDQRLALLQNSVIEHFKTMRRIRGDESRHGLAAGLLLWTIKESLPHGEFGAWAESNIEGFGKTYRAYLMKLALIFIEKMKVQRPEMLAVRGDQIELALDKREALIVRFEERVSKFIGDQPLSVLFEKYGIKEAAKLGGAREKVTEDDDEKEPITPPTPEQLYILSRDEIGSGIERMESLLIRENRLQHLLGHPEEINGVVNGLRALADKVEAAAKAILKPAKA